MHVAILLLSFIISYQVLVPTNLTLVVTIQIVSGGICALDFKDKYMIVELNLLML